MIIGHNLMANNAIRNTNANSGSASTSMQKLSSGAAITTAADDAAGLAISEKMKGQIRGLDTASSNAQDAVSLVQTADGALTETTSILQRMRELANQASNDTNTAADREAISTEADELIAQLDNIANTTQFNTKNLLNGGAGVTGTSTNALDVVLGGTSATTDGSIVNITAASLASAATATRVAAFTDGVTVAAQTLTVSGTTFTFASGSTTADVVQTINQAGLGVTATATTANLTLTSSGVGSAATFTSDASASGTATIDVGVDATITTTDGSYSAVGNVVTMTSGASEGLKFSVGSTAAADITANNDSLTMQIGANQGQTMSVSINSMTSTALGVRGLDYSTQAGATSALSAIDVATATVSSERAKLGAYQNRLESTINNLGTTSENLTAAQSSVTDVDMASEMAEYSKDNVLSQAAQAMLAQANQQPQQVLKLLQ